MSLKSFQKYADKIPYEILKTALTINENMHNNEDYVEFDKDTYICAETAVYLIGRFSLTQYNDLCDILKYLMQPQDKTIECASQLEMDWKDKIHRISMSNAKALNMNYRNFLNTIYKNMGLDMHKSRQEYILQCGNPNISLSDFSVLEYISRVKNLRIAFEREMSKIMAR